MPHNAFDLASNVSQALDIFPPNYVRSFLGDPPSWFTITCPHTELQLAEFSQLPRGLLSLAHILIPALATSPPISLPLSDLFFRPSTVFDYPLGPLAHARGSDLGNAGSDVWNGGSDVWSGGPDVRYGGSEVRNGGPDVRNGGSEVRSGRSDVWRGATPPFRSIPDRRAPDRSASNRNPDREGGACTGSNPTPEQAWFFINGIGTDRSVVLLNAAYLFELFRRPLKVVHNFTRGIVADLAASAVGKEWDQVTESAEVAFPPIYNALKNAAFERVIVIGHSQGTILSAVVLHLLKGLHPALHRKWVSGPAVAPEHAVARRVAARWEHRPEPVSLEELRKLELYCFANCASHMTEVRIGGATAPAWIESYGNEKDIVARLGVLAPAQGRDGVHISGDRYERVGAWGHLFNAHYLCPMMKARARGDPRGGLAPADTNSAKVPRLFAYLDGKSPARPTGIRGMRYAQTEKAPGAASTTGGLAGGLGFAGLRRSPSHPIAAHDRRPCR